MTVSTPNPSTLSQNQQAWAREYALLDQTRKSNFAIRDKYEDGYLTGTLTLAQRKIYEDAAFKQMEAERQLNGFRLDRSDVLDAEYAKLQTQLSRTPADQLFLRNQLEVAMGQLDTA